MLNYSQRYFFQVCIPVVIIRVCCSIRVVGARSAVLIVLLVATVGIGRFTSGVTRFVATSVAVRIAISAARAVLLLFDFEQRCQTDVVLGHDAIEHVFGAFGGGHGYLIELDEIVFDELKARRLEHDGAAVHVLFVLFAHGFGARLGREDAVVVVLLELRQEKVIELFGLKLLQRYYVGVEVFYVVENELFAVVPGERPCWTVAVVLTCGIFVA